MAMGKKNVARSCRVAFPRQHFNIFFSKDVTIWLSRLDEPLVRPRPLLFTDSDTSVVTHETATKTLSISGLDNAPPPRWHHSGPRANPSSAKRHGVRGKSGKF